LAGQHSTFREIGVGTNAPKKATHILRETGGAGVLVERIETSIGGGSFQGRKSRGTESARTAVVSGDQLLSVEGVAYVGENKGYQSAARIGYEVDGSVSDAAVGAPTRMVFKVATGTGVALAEKMRITSTGKVGIGMNDPSTLLTVEGAVTLKEQSTADADVAAYGQVWVKTATPNQLYFTTDAGDDIQITSGTALASASLTQEEVEDFAGAMVASGGTKTGIAVTYQDGTGDMDFVVSDLTVTSDSGSTAMTPGDTLTVAGGTNISTAMSGDTLTINQSGGGEANESSFKTISVSGQSDVVADADDDTLTLVGGSNVTITTTAGTDTISFAATDTNTTYSAGDGLDISGTTFSTDLKSNGGLVIESTELAVDLGASSVTGTLGVGDGGSGQTSYTNGQLLIGNTTGNTLTKTTLTAGSNVTITNGTGTISIAAANTTYTAGDGLDLSGTTFSTDLKANGGLVIESTEAALDLGASSITGTLAVGDGGSGQTSYTNGQLLIGNTTGNTLAKATLTAGSNVSITNGTGTITVAATDTNTTYSAGTLLDLATTTFNVDLTEAAEAVMANGDYILFLDGGATGSHAKEAIADVATLFAGDGLTASSSVMAVNVDGSTIETNSDAIRVKDNGVTLAKMAGLTRGSIIYGDASGDPAALGVGSNTYVLTSDGTDISWASAGGGSGDITSVVAGAGMTGGATSGAATLNVIGGDGITANADEIEATVDDSTIELSASDGSGTIRVKDNGVTLAKMAGLTRGSIIYGDASGDPAALGVGSNTYVLTSDGTDVAWASAGGGGGSGDVEAGSTFTTAGVIMACDGDDKTIDEPTALLTTNGQGMTVSASLATPFQVDSSTRDGNSTFKFTTGSGAGTNNQASIQLIAQTAANANLYLGDTASATKGGLKYKNSGDSMQLIASGAAVLELDSAKVVEFKIAEDDDSSGSGYIGAYKMLKIKVNGTEYWLQLYEESGGGGGGFP
jgi:hypothetical protein